MQKQLIFSGIAGMFLLMSCQTARIASIAKKQLAGDSSLAQAHTGIALYDPQKKHYLYRLQADKYFVPASNTKIFSSYAAMKLLGDQLPGIRYVELDTVIVLIPTGDPTFLHRDFLQQPVADFIRRAVKPLYIDVSLWSTPALGYGWSWDDYSASYMAERSPLPVYGNVVRWYQVKGKKEQPATPADTVDTFIYSDPELEGPVSFGKPERSFRVDRARDQNAFTIFEGDEKLAETDVPFVTNGIETSLDLLRDSLHKEIRIWDKPLSRSVLLTSKDIYSRPVDSMLQPMMWRSDNFFAEQTLLMAGSVLTGKLNMSAAVQSVSKELLQGIPDKPRWVDGSGLSRYNLFTPQDFVWVLERMKNEFSWERITTIFPTGGKGTLRPYVGEQGRLYAKTGTLSGVIALSGYVITKKNRTLIFSILINNHQQSTAVLRSRMGAFLKELIDRY